MTNEELAILAKTDQDALLELWSQTKRFAFKIAQRYGGFLERNRAFDWEDLEQICFLALMDAVKLFDSERAGFLTMLKWRVMRHIRRALGVERKLSIESNFWVDSMDAPLTFKDGSTVDPHEAIKDPNAPDPEAETVLVTMCEDVEDAVNRLSKRQQQAVRAFYCENRTMQEIAESMGTTRGAVNSLITDARRKLRRDEVLRGYVPNYYRPGSVQRFMSSWTSSVEEEVLRKLDWMDRERAAKPRIYP